jgi:hypothetical protein
MPTRNVKRKDAVILSGDVKGCSVSIYLSAKASRSI